MRSLVMRALVAMLAATAAWSMLPGAAYATFPGPNGKLAFGSARSGYPADNDLYTMAANGTAETRLTGMNWDELNPSWSPSGAEVTFERTTGAFRSDIWIANADGSNVRRLTSDPASDMRPAFSNTGAKIVFASDRNSTNGTSDLFVMDANGANQVPITNTPAIDEDYPSWSPDGASIAFSREGDLYKISPTGAGLTPLTTTAGTDIEPDWSPSGSQIVFRRYANFGDELWKINANGTGPAILTTNGSIVEEHPVWSPQGDKIAFIRGAFRDAEVYTMNPDGTGATRITTNTVLDASPAWQRVPSTPPPPPPPPQPAVLTSVTQANGVVSAAWTLPAGTESWELEVGTSTATDAFGYFLDPVAFPDPPLQRGDTGGTASPGLPAGTYYVHVIGTSTWSLCEANVDDPGCVFTFSNTMTVTVPGSPPPAPPPPPATTPPPAPAPPASPSPVAAADTIVALGAVTASRKQDVDKLSITLKAGEAVKVKLSGSVKVPGASKVYRFKTVKRSLGSGRTKLALKLARKYRRAVKRALKRKKRLKAKLTLVVTDSAGNTRTKKYTVRLTP